MRLAEAVLCATVLRRRPHHRNNARIAVTALFSKWSREEGHNMFISTMFTFLLLLPLLCAVAVHTIALKNTKYALNISWLVSFFPDVSLLILIYLETNPQFIQGTKVATHPSLSPSFSKLRRHESKLISFDTFCT